MFCFVKKRNHWMLRVLWCNRPLQGSFLTRNSSRAVQPPPTLTINVLRRIRTIRNCWESPNCSKQAKHIWQGLAFEVLIAVATSYYISKISLTCSSQSKANSMKCTPYHFLCGHWKPGDYCICYSCFNIF